MGGAGGGEVLGDNDSMASYSFLSNLSTLVRTSFYLDTPSFPEQWTETASKEKSFLS